MRRKSGGGIVQPRLPGVAHQWCSPRALLSSRPPPGGIDAITLGGDPVTTFQPPALLAASGSTTRHRPRTWQSPDLRRHDDDHRVPRQTAETWRREGSNASVASWVFEGGWGRPCPFKKATHAARGTLASCLHARAGPRLTSLLTITDPVGSAPPPSRSLCPVARLGSAVHDESDTESD